MVTRFDDPAASRPRRVLVVWNAPAEPLDATPQAHVEGDRADFPVPGWALLDQLATRARRSRPRSHPTAGTVRFARPQRRRPHQPARLESTPTPARSRQSLAMDSVACDAGVAVSVPPAQQWRRLHRPTPTTASSPQRSAVPLGVQPVRSRYAATATGPPRISTRPFGRGWLVRDPYATASGVTLAPGAGREQGGSQQANSIPSPKEVDDT